MTGAGSFAERRLAKTPGTPTTPKTAPGWRFIPSLVLGVVGVPGVLAVLGVLAEKAHNAVDAYLLNSH